MLRTPPSRFIRAIQVPAGFDVADAHIVDQLKAGDLVITADIPLAAAVLERQARALPAARCIRRQHRRAPVDAQFSGELRGSGVQTGGPAAFSQADRQAFGGALDRFLARQPKP
jgi:uncharacterized protein YaiI (UPF0178 family)